MKLNTNIRYKPQIVIHCWQIVLMFANVERMSSSGLEATTFRLTTNIGNRIELKY